MSANTLPSFAHIDPNALNVAAAKGGKILEIIDDTMDSVRRQETFSITQGIKAAFGVASALFIEGIAGACVNALGAGGMANEYFNTLKTEKELAPKIEKLQKKEPGFEKELKSKDNEIKTLEDSLSKSPTPEQQREHDQAKAKLNREKTIINDKKTKNRNEIDDKNRQISNVAQKANTKSQIWNMAGTGASALSSGITKMLQEQRKAVQSISQAMQQMFSSTYNKSKDIGSGFWNVEFFKALQALAVQLR